MAFSNPHGAGFGQIAEADVYRGKIVRCQESLVMSVAQHTVRKRELMAGEEPSCMTERLVAEGHGDTFKGRRTTTSGRIWSM